MRISGNINNGIVFEPRDGELLTFLNMFDAKVSPCMGGYTWQAYERVPMYTIKGVEYFGATAEQTRAFSTPQEALTSLKLTVANNTDQIVSVENGLRLPDIYTVNLRTQGYSLDHIPQLFERIGTDAIIISFVGEWDFSRRRFTGVIEKVKLQNLW